MAADRILALGAMLTLERYIFVSKACSFEQALLKAGEGTPVSEGSGFQSSSLSSHPKAWTPLGAPAKGRLGPRSAPAAQASASQEA
ncbi:hypothetical protein CCMA1212_004356 [Trichoderma ghanense]|uniref:Uncharacterized protein n=1 Tax=Trichoderma ghanense TaxID=65468 RepID=A0ABY2H6P6_9HYPO